MQNIDFTGIAAFRQPAMLDAVHWQAMKAIAANETFYAPDRATWREWLQQNNQTSTGVWLVFYKQHVPKPSIRYPEALEEALCYGWIDSVLGRIDDERYKRRFTPRRPNSKWSAVNLRLADKLKAQGLMTEAGLRKMDGAQSPASLAMRAVRVRSAKLTVPPQLKAALAKNKKAVAHFESLAPSHRRLYLLWITSAKKDETRARRVKEAIQMLAKGKELGMK